MELKDIALWYASERLGYSPDIREAERLDNQQVLALLWEFHPLFTPRMPAITATEYSEAFDDEADGALASLALSNSFDAWEALSAGA